MVDQQPCCKVGTAINQYDLSNTVHEDTIDQTLVERWLGVGNAPETAVRPLKDWLNKQILQTVYTEHGRKSIETQIESDYAALTGDDADRQQLVIDDLEADGIDTDSLLDSFVSTATMYRHLTKCLEETKESQSSERDWESEKIAYTIETASQNIEDVLRSWENKGVVPQASEAEVSVRLYASCPECGTQTDLRYLKDRGFVCKEHLDS